MLIDFNGFQFSQTASLTITVPLLEAGWGSAEVLIAPQGGEAQVLAVVWGWGVNRGLRNRANRGSQVKAEGQAELECWVTSVTSPSAVREWVGESRLDQIRPCTWPTAPCFKKSKVWKVERRWGERQARAGSFSMPRRGLLHPAHLQHR